MGVILTNTERRRSGSRERPRSSIRSTRTPRRSVNFGFRGPVMSHLFRALKLWMRLNHRGVEGGPAAPGAGLSVYRAPPREGHRGRRLRDAPEAEPGRVLVPLPPGRPARRRALQACRGRYRPPHSAHRRRTPARVCSSQRPRAGTTPSSGCQSVVTGRCRRTSTRRSRRSGDTASASTVRSERGVPTLATGDAPTRALSSLRWRR